MDLGSRYLITILAIRTLKNLLLAAGVEFSTSAVLHLESAFGLCRRLRWEVAIEMLTSTTCIRTMVAESEYDIRGCESTQSFLEIELILA